MEWRINRSEDQMSVMWKTSIFQSNQNCIFINLHYTSRIPKKTVWSTHFTLLQYNTYLCTLRYANTSIEDHETYSSRKIAELQQSVPLVIIKEHRTTKSQNTEVKQQWDEFQHVQENPKFPLQRSAPTHIADIERDLLIHHDFHFPILE